MKTLKQVLHDNSAYSRLIKAVSTRLDIESVKDVTELAGRVVLFVSPSPETYHDCQDTVAFTKKYRRDIIRLIEDLADSMGKDIMKIILDIADCSKNQLNCMTRTTAEDYKGFCAFLGGGQYREDYIYLWNNLCWFAVEEICTMFID